MHKSRLTVEVEELSCLLVDHVSLIRPLDATTLSTAEKSVDISLVRYQTSTQQRLEERMNYFRQSELAFEVDILHNTDRVLLLLPHEKSSRDH